MLVLLAVSLTAAALCGCRSSSPTAATLASSAPAATPRKPADLMTRNNSLTLLDQLLDDEKNVHFLLVIKSATPELKRLVKTISQTSGEGSKMIKACKKGDPGLSLPGNGLPPGETAARAGLSKTKEHDLLHSKGPELELQLLLTQAEALGYGAQLSLDVAVNDPQADRSRQFARLSEQLKLLHEQVIAMLRERQPTEPPKN